MSHALTADDTQQAARRRQAMAAGVFYAANIATILAAIWLMRGIVAPRDPAMSAANVLAHAPRLRAGLGLELASTACSIAVAALLYRLFKPVNASVSAIAAFFRLAACAVAVTGYVLQFAPLEILADGRGTAGLDAAQLAAVTLVLFRLHGLASNIVVLLFGCHFMALGYLVFRSGFLPRALGVLASAAGVGALIVLSPVLAATLFRYFAGLGLVTELSLTLSLLVIGLRDRSAGRSSHTLI